MHKIISNQTLPIILNLLAAIAGAAGQYFYKLGSSQLDVIPLYRNVALLAGVILFCVVMTLFVTAFRMGGRMSIVYPAYATTFIWATFIAVFIAKEPWSIAQLLGVTTIIAGVALIAIGGPK